MQSLVPTHISSTADDLQNRIGQFARFGFIIALAIFVAGRTFTMLDLGFFSINDFTSPDRIAFEIALISLFLTWQRWSKCAASTSWNGRSHRRSDWVSTFQWTLRPSFLHVSQKTVKTVPHPQWPFEQRSLDAKTPRTMLRWSHVRGGITVEPNYEPAEGRLSEVGRVHPAR